MHTLFVYGTLISEEVMQRVTGRRFPGCEAILKDHARFRIKNTPYPALIFRKGSSVEGTLYFTIDDASLQRIDTFEGPLYERAEVEIVADNGQRHHSFVYRIRERYAHLLTNESWDIRKFIEQDLQSFLNELDAESR